MAKFDSFALSSPLYFSCFKSLVMVLSIYSKVVKTSVSFTCKGWAGCFKPYFKTSNSSVANVVVDKLWIASFCVNGSAMFLVKFLIFFYCILMVVFVDRSIFFSTALSSTNLSTEDKMFWISFS